METEHKNPLGAGLLYIRRGEVKLFCRECGAGFGSRNLAAKFCSEKCGEIYQKRRKKRRGVNNLRLRFEILVRDGFRCRYCGRSPNDGIVLCVDHILSRKDGGTDESHNLITACVDCNVGKGALKLLSKKGQIPTFLVLA